MKKLIALTAALLLTLSACSSASPKDASDQPQPSTAPQVVIVPNVVGMNKDDAVKKLEGLGLKVTTKNVRVQYKYDIPEKEYMLPNGEVTQQSMQEGLAVGQGTEIKISYAMQECDLMYSVNPDGTITINEYGSLIEDNGYVTIPSEYDGYVISKIDVAYFISCFDTTKYGLRIPENITVTGEDGNRPVKIIRY